MRNKDARAAFSEWITTWDNKERRAYSGDSKDSRYSKGIYSVFPVRQRMTI